MSYQVQRVDYYKLSTLISSIESFEKFEEYDEITKKMREKLKEEVKKVPFKAHGGNKRIKVFKDIFYFNYGEIRCTSARSSTMIDPWELSISDEDIEKEWRKLKAKAKNIIKKEINNVIKSFQDERYSNRYSDGNYLNDVCVNYIKTKARTGRASKTFVHTGYDYSGNDMLVPLHAVPLTLYLYIVHGLRENLAKKYTNNIARISYCCRYMCQNENSRTLSVEYMDRIVNDISKVIEKCNKVIDSYPLSLYKKAKIHNINECTMPVFFEKKLGYGSYQDVGFYVKNIMNGIIEHAISNSETLEGYDAISETAEKIRNSSEYCKSDKELIINMVKLYYEMQEIHNEDIKKIFVKKGYIDGRSMIDFDLFMSKVDECFSEDGSRLLTIQEQQAIKEVNNGPE